MTSPAPYKTTLVFDENTLPAALRAEHRTKPGVWGVIRVLEGELRYRVLEQRRRPQTVGNGSYICFAVEDRTAVDRFHAIAPANGGSSDGEPGLRPKYDDNYYGAFVRDPDDNKIEAVTYSAK
jgi:tellurite resistance-related uncharacterized protein